MADILTIRPATPDDHDPRERFCEYPECDLVGPVELMYQTEGGAWTCPTHSAAAGAADRESVGSFLGNALAIWRLTEGNPNREELSRICTLARQAALETRRLIECARQHIESDAPWDRATETEATPAELRLEAEEEALFDRQVQEDDESPRIDVPDLTSFRTEGQ